MRERARENGPGESVGEQIGLSNQRDGSRGLPTAAHWPGSRVRYRIIAATRRESPLRYIDAVHLSRRALEPAYAPRNLRSISRDYPPFDRAAAIEPHRRDEATRENAGSY